MSGQWWASKRPPIRQIQKHETIKSQRKNEGKIVIKAVSTETGRQGVDFTVKNGQNTAPNGNRGKYIHSNFHSKWARPKWALLWTGPRHEMWAQTHTVDMHTAPMTDSKLTADDRLRQNSSTSDGDSDGATVTLSPHLTVLGVGWWMGCDVMGC